MHHSSSNIREHLNLIICCFFRDYHQTSLKQAVHPSDFENKRFPLNAWLLSGLFQTGKVQTKTDTTERNVRWLVKQQVFSFRIAGVQGSLERRVRNAVRGIVAHEGPKKNQYR